MKLQFQLLLTAVSLCIGQMHASEDNAQLPSASRTGTPTHELSSPSVVAEPISPPALQALATSAEKELRENILPFWLKYARFPERGGFHSFIGEDMIVRDDMPRGALLTTRILWAFSAAYRHYPDPAYLAMARYAYADLTKNFLDQANGGLFWTITPEGKPLDAHKQIYGQVFGIYALTEYYRASGDKGALDQAIAIYRLIEKYARDPKYDGYVDALDRKWQRETGSQANLLGEGPKSQNSHIHILEGFSSLLRVWPDPGLRERQRELVELMLTRIIDPKTHHLILFMRDDWTPIGHDVSYGHDIELSWLLVEAAEVLGDPALIVKAKREALAIAKVTAQEGIDVDGGVYTEGNPQGPTNTNKEWWEQAESAVGFLNAYQLSGEAKDFKQSLKSWTFIQEKFVDRTNGGWHNVLRRDGSPILSSTLPNGQIIPTGKLSLWKCPYHNSRCCLELIDRVEQELGNKR